MLIGKYSSSAHELLLPFLVVTPVVMLLVLLLSRGWCVLLVLRPRGDELPDRGRAHRAGDLEGPGKRPTTDGELEALDRGVQVRPSTGCPSRRVREDLEALSPVTGDDTQQICLRGSLPTSDARADTSLDGVAGQGSARTFERRWRTTGQSSL